MTQADSHLLAPSAAFTAKVTSAPADKAVISGTVTLEVEGSNIANVELLPATGYTPKYAVFKISADKTTATASLDTTKLADGNLAVRISAFNAPAGSGTAKEVVAMPARTWTIRNQGGAGTFTAHVTEAPANGATVSGPVRLVVNGTNLQNVELLPASGYSPKYATFTISADRKRAIAVFETSRLPNNTAIRISAFNAPAGSGTAKEIVAMPARTWSIKRSNSWRIVDLGQLVVQQSTGGMLNDVGEVIGTIGQHGYKYRNGRLTDLGTLGGPVAQPRAINNYGHVVGSSTRDGGSYGAFLHQGGSMIDIGSKVNPSALSVGHDINDLGDIVLTAADRPFLYARNGAVTSLDYLRQKYTRDMAINNSGQIVLNYDLKYASTVLFSNGSATNLALPIGGYPSSHTSYGMNSNGNVVGISNNRAFWYSTGMNDISGLGTGVIPFAINDSSQIVGQAVRNGTYYAFLYWRGRLLDLNSLPGMQPAGWRLEMAVGINNSGQILGMGFNPSGQWSTFLLKPPSLTG